MGLEDYGLTPGSPADVLVLDCETPAQAVAELAPAVMGFKRGRLSFTRPAARLLPPPPKERQDAAK